MDDIKKNNRFEIDMCNGNIFLKMIKFCIPLILTSLLQLFYNAADLIVVSQLSGDANAVGAVGSCSSLISLCISLFMGLGVGCNVMSAKMFAVKNEKGMNKVVHSAFILGIGGGLILGIIGFFISKPLLLLMDNPLEQSAIYLKIYFIGLPFNLLYNFMASILRGVGDTKRPLIFLTIAGIINVILNVILVLLGLGVAGVAIATIISQLVSCILVMICLIKSKESYHFSFSDLKIHPHEIKEILRIGLPAGLQGSIFSISNVLIQSSVNSFDVVANIITNGELQTPVMNGNAAAISLESFIYVSMNSVYHGALSFMGQNVGAKRYENMKKVTLSSLAIVSIIGIVMGTIFFFLEKPLFSIYLKNGSEMEYDVACIRFIYFTFPYFLCGTMDVMCGNIRGMGHAVTPMLVSLIGACGLRILWILFIFRPLTDFTDYHDLHLLYVSYPISWLVTFVAHLIVYFIDKKKLIKNNITQ